MRKVYVVGFAFNPTKDAVALIAKTNNSNHAGEIRPEWLANKLNGIGTDLYEGELPIDGMVRTFSERAGCDTIPDQWVSFHQIETVDSLCLFYKSVLFAHQWRKIRTMTAESVFKQIGPNSLDERSYPVVDNLRWLIPMALDSSHDYSVSFNGKADEAYIGQAWVEFKDKTQSHLEPPFPKFPTHASFASLITEAAKVIRDASITAANITADILQSELNNKKLTNSEIKKLLVDCLEVAEKMTESNKGNSFQIDVWETVREYAEEFIKGVAERNSTEPGQKNTDGGRQINQADKVFMVDRQTGKAIEITDDIVSQAYKSMGVDPNEQDPNERLVPESRR